MPAWGPVYSLFPLTALFLCGKVLFNGPFSLVFARNCVLVLPCRWCWWLQRLGCGLLPILISVLFDSSSKSPALDRCTSRGVDKCMYLLCLLFFPSLLIVVVVFLEFLHPECGSIFCWTICRELSCLHSCFVFGLVFCWTYLSSGGTSLVRLVFIYFY